MEYSVEIELGASCTGTVIHVALALGAWLLFHARRETVSRAKLVERILQIHWPLGESLPWIETAEIEDGIPHTFLNAEMPVHNQCQSLNPSINQAINH